MTSNKRDACTPQEIALHSCALGPQLDPQSLELRLFTGEAQLARFNFLLQLLDLLLQGTGEGSVETRRRVKATRLSTGAKPPFRGVRSARLQAVRVPLGLLQGRS